MFKSWWLHTNKLCYCDSFYSHGANAHVNKLTIFYFSRFSKFDLIVIANKTEGVWYWFKYILTFNGSSKGWVALQTFSWKLSTILFESLSTAYCIRLSLAFSPQDHHICVIKQTKFPECAFLVICKTVGVLFQPVRKHTYTQTITHTGPFHLSLGSPSSVHWAGKPSFAWRLVWFC